jgi:hypothetical protein
VLLKEWGVLTALIVVALGAAVAVARGAPPAGSDPNSALATWYRSLTQPDTGFGCCSIADCRPLADSDWRQTDKGYEVRWRNEWLLVPQGRILNNKENPTGQPVACIYGSPSEVHCFVRPPET